MEKDLQPNQLDTATIEPLLKIIKEKHGDSLMAILVYGSWLRGKRDTMLDFYVLVEDYRTLDSAWQGYVCRLLPPNVYHICHKLSATQVDDAGSRLDEQRAKYALLTLDQFCHAMQHDFHSYFWARFAQPCKILFVRDRQTSEALLASFEMASATFMRYVLPVMPDHFSSRELWTSGLSQTYRCELRTESKNHADSLYDFNPGYYDGIILSMASSHTGLSVSAQDKMFCNQSNTATRKFSAVSWWMRRVQGKLLSGFRLLKAAFTFNDALQYLLWKVERHTGVYIEPSARQLKHPLIFAWPLLWKMYKQGAFR